MNPMINHKTPLIKALSMKRIWLMLDDFMVIELKRSPESEHQRIFNNDRHLLKRFLKYIEEHKNDDI